MQYDDRDDRHIDYRHIDYRHIDYRHIEETYDLGADDYNAHFQQPHEFIEPERQQFLERLPLGSRILDCGCGPGMDSERFASLGLRVTAIDLSDRCVALTKARVPQADVEKMDMRDLRFPSHTFDGVWASFSLLHIRQEDVDTTLAGFARVLEPGGHLFAALHRGPTTAWVHRRISGMERDTYVQEWAPADIEAALHRAGFRNITSRSFERKGGRYPLISFLAQT